MSKKYRNGSVPNSGGTMKTVVKENIYWIGVNDRDTARFENTWPLDKGVAYNSYLVVDEKIAIIDTVKFSKTGEYLEKIKAVIGERPADYLVVNHMEPDHSSSIADILKEYPNIQVVGNKKTLPFIRGFYGVEPNFLEVKEGEELSLGQRKLTFFMTPMLHWPESMMTYESTLGVLFSMDAFGAFCANNGGVFDDEGEFDEDEMRRYYSNIVAKYSNMVQTALKKLANIKVDIIAPSHGKVWRADPGKVVGLYDKWSRYEADNGVIIVYGSMYGNTAKMAEYLGRSLAVQGVKNIKIYDSADTHLSYILSDMWKYKSIVIGSCAYNTKVYGPVDSILRKLTNTSLKNRYLSIFGNKCWSGGGVSGIEAFAQEIGWERIGESIEATYSPAEAEYKALDRLAEQIAAKLKEDYPEA